MKSLKEGVDEIDVIRNRIMTSVEETLDRKLAVAGPLQGDGADDEGWNEDGEHHRRNN
jgi:hypothetical protein